MFYEIDGDKLLAIISSNLREKGKLNKEKGLMHAISHRAA